MATAPVLDANRRSHIEQIVREYITVTKHWPDNEFRVEILDERVVLDPAILVVDAVHHDDLKKQGRGPSKSVQVHVNVQSGAVLTELAYQ